MANAGPLMDRFALAEGSPNPNVKTMLEQAAAKRIHGIRTVLITTRTESSSGQQELRKTVEQVTADMLSGVEVVEADFSRLRSIFEFV
jgi:hypothetical protein